MREKIRKEQNKYLESITPNIFSKTDEEHETTDVESLANRKQNKQRPPHLIDHNENPKYQNKEKIFKNKEKNILYPGVQS